MSGSNHSNRDQDGNGNQQNNSNHGNQDNNGGNQQNNSNHGNQDGNQNITNNINDINSSNIVNYTLNQTIIQPGYTITNQQGTNVNNQETTYTTFTSTNSSNIITPTEKKNETRLFIFIYLKTMF